MNARSESGQVVVFIVFGLAAIVAIVALAVDGGQLFAERRTAQNAADNAALAAAYAVCGDGDPNAAALSSALANGFDNNGTTNTVTLNHPPISGPNAGDNEYSEAIITSQRDTFFAQLIGQGDLEVTTRAVSRCRESFDYAVLALTTRNDIHGLTVDGSGDLVVNNGGIMSNSSHPTEALYDKGSGKITAEEIHANGGVTCSGVCTPEAEGGRPVVPDPLASLPPPPKPGGSCIYANHSSATEKTVTLYPGLYCEISGDANIDFVLESGIYYIDGPGGFEGGGTSSITGAGVMIYLSPTAGPSSMSGNTLINISACDPASPGAWCVGPLEQYAGMVFYADRSYTQPISMTGNSTWNAVGTIYAAGSALDLSGNNTVNNLSSMIIADTIKLGGSTNVIVDYDPGLNVTPPASVSLID